jgi:hypothetical protein
MRTVQATERRDVVDPRPACRLEKFRSRWLAGIDAPADWREEPHYRCDEQRVGFADTLSESLSSGR